MNSLARNCNVVVIDAVDNELPSRFVRERFQINMKFHHRDPHHHNSAVHCMQGIDSQQHAIPPAIAS
jgi:hypothetical protein